MLNQRLSLPDTAENRDYCPPRNGVEAHRSSRSSIRSSGGVWCRGRCGRISVDGREGGRKSGSFRVGLANQSEVAVVAQ